MRTTIEEKELHTIPAHREPRICPSPTPGGGFVFVANDDGYGECYVWLSDTEAAELSALGVKRVDCTEWRFAETMNEIETVLCSAGEMFDGGNDRRRAEIASDWSDHDFDADEVSSWVEAGCWDASTAAELRDAGFRPGVDELEYKPGMERDGMDAMYAFCNGDTTLKKVQW